MRLEELIIDEPKKISKKELEDLEKAFDVFMDFCMHLQELAVYNLNDKISKYSKELQRQIKMNLKLILLRIMNDTKFCSEEAIEFLKRRKEDG